MNKYRVLRAFGYLDADGNAKMAKLGSVVEMSAAEAKPMAKINAIGLYFEDDDEAPAPESRASKRAKRTRKPEPKEEAVEDAPVQD